MVVFWFGFVWSQNICRSPVSRLQWGTLGSDLMPSAWDRAELGPVWPRDTVHLAFALAAVRRDQGVFAALGHQGEQAAARGSQGRSGCGHRP